MRGVNESLTVEQAKQAAMDMESEIAALVPQEHIESIEQDQEGVLLSCDDDRGYQWTGQTNVTLRREVDPAVIVDAAVAEYEGRDSYTANADTTVDGEPRAHVRGEYGAAYLLARSVDGTAMEILSFSPCFRLPEDMSPGGTY